MSGTRYGPNPAEEAKRAAEGGKRLAEKIRAALACTHADQTGRGSDGRLRMLYSCSHCGRCYPCEHERVPGRAAIPKIGWRCADGTVRTGFDEGPLAPEPPT